MNSIWKARLPIPHSDSIQPTQPLDTANKDIMRKRLGAMGEEMACSLLRERGYEILDRNYRSSHREIDIICRDGQDLRFVEVKARREPMEGEAWEAVTVAKQRRIASAAGAYLRGPRLRELGFRPDEYHFDVVTIVWNEDGDQCRKEYIPDAYTLIYA